MALWEGPDPSDGHHCSFSLQLIKFISYYNTHSKHVRILNMNATITFIIILTQVVRGFKAPTMNARTQSTALNQKMWGLISPDLFIQLFNSINRIKGVSVPPFYFHRGPFTLLLKPHISAVFITVSRIRLLTDDLCNNSHHKSSS